MKKIIYLFLILTASLKAQVVIPDCGMTLRDTLVTTYVEFRQCAPLIMASGSYLKVDYLQGSGNIFYTNPDDVTPIIEFTGCFPYQNSNVYIDNTIIIIQPDGCETLSVEDVNPNDRDHLKPLDCVVYNNLGQKIYEGKFENVRYPVIGIYYVKFEFFSIKVPITKND